MDFRFFKETTHWRSHDPIENWRNCDPTEIWRVTYTIELNGVRRSMFIDIETRYDKPPAQRIARQILKEEYPGAEIVACSCKRMESVEHRHFVDI